MKKKLLSTVLVLAMMLSMLSAAAMTAYADGSFAPNKDVSREQMVVFLYRCAQLAKIDTSARADLAAFKDSGSVSEYAKEAMSWAVAEGIVNGVSQESLAPQGDATRAQVVSVIARFTDEVSGQRTTGE